MPTSCIVPFCKNRGSAPGLRYFRITNDRRISWLRALGRDPYEEISNYCVVCSHHFREEDFLASGKLQNDAVPTLKLRPQKPTFSCATRFNTRSPEVIYIKSLTTNFINEDETNSCSTVTAGRLLEQVEESSTGTRERKEQTSPSDPLRLTHSPKRHVFPLDHNYSLTLTKMRDALQTSERSRSLLQTRLRRSKQTIKRLKARVKDLNTLVSHLANNKLIVDEARSTLEQSYSGISLTKVRRIFDRSQLAK